MKSDQAMSLRSAFPLLVCAALCFISGALSGYFTDSEPLAGDLRMSETAYYMPGLLFGLAWGIVAIRNFAKLLLFCGVSTLIYYLVLMIALSGTRIGSNFIVSAYFASFLGAASVALAGHLFLGKRNNWLVNVGIGVVGLICTPLALLTPLGFPISFAIWQVAVGVAMMAFIVLKPEPIMEGENY